MTETAETEAPGAPTHWLVDGYNVLRVGFSRAAEQDARERGLLSSADPSANSSPKDALADATAARGEAGEAGGAPAERGWWTAPRRSALVELAGRAASANDRIVVVFDGSRGGPSPAEANGTAPLHPTTGADGHPDADGAAGAVDVAPERASVVFAPSADEWIVAEVKRRAALARTLPGTSPASLATPLAASPAGSPPDGPATRVVTADRPLASRSRHHGALVSSPKDFVERCLSNCPGERGSG